MGNVSSVAAILRTGARGGLAAAAFITVGAAWGQPPRVTTNNIWVVPPPPSFEASLSLNRRAYAIGERVRITFQATQDAHVFIFSTDAAGVERQIFPNFFDQSNRVRANSSRTIPSGGYDLVATGPPGRNVVTLVAVRSDVPILAEWLRFSQGDPYPVRAGGAHALAQRARAAAPEDSSDGPAGRGIAVVDKYDPQVAEASVEFSVTSGVGPWSDDSRASIDVRTEPPGARVFLNSDLVGVTPFPPARVSPGSYRLRIERNGYWTAERRINVRKGESTRIRLQLIREE